MADNLDAVAERIAKLLQLAEKNPNAAEAASALAKANALMIEHNLTEAAVEQAKGGKAARQEQLLAGGMYQWQRDLWNSVARLNFCLCWTRQHWTLVNPSGPPGKRYKNVWRHRVVGRKANVAATIAMAQYLEAAVERLVAERIGSQNNLRFTRWAVSFREGAAEDIMRRVWDRYHKLKRAKDAEAEKARRAAVDAQAAGFSGGTALTLSVYVDQETDGNIDFAFGEGTAAALAAEKQKNARLAAMSEAEYTRWAADNPEEAREYERERRREERGERDKRANKRDWGAFSAGMKAGKKVSIDQQVAKDARRLSRD